MSGYPEFNFPAFHAAAAKLRADGWHVYNPAEKSSEENLDKKAVQTGDTQLAIKKGWSFQEAYLWDITAVISSQAIYMLPGWQYSPGANGEHAVAVALKKHDPDYQIIYGS